MGIKFHSSLILTTIIDTDGNQEFFQSSKNLPKLAPRKTVGADLLNLIFRLVMVENV